MPIGRYDPADEVPVLEKMQRAGWIRRHWSDRQDLSVEWADGGVARLRDWRSHAAELGPLTRNQQDVLDFFVGYLND